MRWGGGTAPNGGTSGKPCIGIASGIPGGLLFPCIRLGGPGGGGGCDFLSSAIMSAPSTVMSFSPVIAVGRGSLTPPGHMPWPAIGGGGLGREGGGRLIAEVPFKLGSPKGET